jgi:Leucine-rich repeat (LRR) protein
VSSETPDRNRLNHLYEITNGPLWKSNTHWNSTKPVCSWFGVECANGSAEDDTGVTSINLPSNGLAGRVSKIIYEMKDLKILNFKDNSLTDPGFEGLLRDSKLETIILSGNGFTNINGIGNAPDSLQQLHVTHNRIKGSFPVELTKLTKLKNIFLNQNELQGSLPTQIGYLSQLTQLFLYGNNMTGELPSEIGLLGNLEIFTLAENQFTGTIPATVEKMSSLHSFSLHNAALTGTLPVFRNIPFLTEVFLDNNQLEGTIPRQFLDKSVILYEHVHVGLSYNNLTGAVPPDLERFTFLELDLVGNQMTEIPEEICQSVIGSWMSGLVEHYGCDAIVCAIGTYNQDGRQSNDDSPCLACPNGTGSPYLGATSCNGEKDMSELDIIVDLYVSLRGSAWVQKSGWAEFDDLLSSATIVQPDAVNVCSFHGITCNANKSIEEIKLSNNGLIGTVPTTIFQLSSLTTLDLSRNAATVTPEGLSALARAGTVSKLHIASTHSIDLTGIGAANSLRVLDVSGIEFGTPVPSELFNLVDIEEIHARFCYFTDKLPTLIGNLVNLVR